MIVSLISDLLVREIATMKANETVPLIDRKGAKIALPGEVFSDLEAGERVRVASVLLRNMSGFLPESLSEDMMRLVRKDMYMFT